MIAALLAVSLAAANPVRDAERLADSAMLHAAERPQEALLEARKALGLTTEFEPTVFVKAGRKGEVVEDEFLAARRAYRRHRARLYEAVGECLLRKGEPAAATRYLRRSVHLDPTPIRAVRLARSLLAEGRGPAALEVLHQSRFEEVGAEMAAVFEQAADMAGVPSAQAEIDRAGLAALGMAVSFRDGPLTPPAGSRLSTGGPLDLTAGVTVIFLAEATCRSCSQDLEALARAVPAGTRVVVVPEDPERDHALRQVLSLYRHNWPVALGKGMATTLGMRPRSVLVVARKGWAGVAIDSPFADSLAATLKVFARTAVQEVLPRASWNRKRLERRATAAPGLLPEGLAPGEDEPPPEAFATAVQAYRDRRGAEALRLMEALEGKGDGWLLPPEGRLNRALCLAAIGQRDAARRLLLAIGDSRFQDAVDKALESVGTPRKR